jgi:predicted DNA-binding transcriptional regulator AlpA
MGDTVFAQQYPPVVTSKQVREMLGVGVNTMYSHVLPNIPHRRIGSQYRFLRSDVEAFMRESEKESGNEG